MTKSWSFSNQTKTPQIHCNMPENNPADSETDGHFSLPNVVQTFFYKPEKYQPDWRNGEIN